MVDHCDVDDECLRALISSIGDIDEWGLLDYEINVGGEYNEIASEPIIEEQRQRDSIHIEENMSRLNQIMFMLGRLFGDKEEAYETYICMHC